MRWSLPSVSCLRWNCFFIHHLPVSHYRFKVIWLTLVRVSSRVTGSLGNRSGSCGGVLYIHNLFWSIPNEHYSACMCSPNCGSKAAANTFVKIVPSRLAPSLLGWFWLACHTPLLPQFQGSYTAILARLSSLTTHALHLYLYSNFFTIDYTIYILMSLKTNNIPLQIQNFISSFSHHYYYLVSRQR